MAGDTNQQRRVTMTDILLASEKQNQERTENIAKRTSGDLPPANQSSPAGSSPPANQSSDDKLASADGQSVPAAPELSSQPIKPEKIEHFPKAELLQPSKLLPAASSSPDDSRGPYHLPMTGDVQLAPHANLSHLIDQAPVFNNWTAWPNEIFDKVLPLLKPQDQVVLLRLYRLSRGFKNDTCLVTINKLASSCNISGREVYRSIERLESRGLVKRISVDFNNKNLHERGTTFKVYLPIVNTAKQAGGVKQSPPAKQAPDDRMSDIKYTNTKDTHTNISTRTSGAYPTQEKLRRNAAVGVSSRFSLEDCQRFGQHLHRTGQGITNPGGYATTIHRTGEADEMIERFLHSPAPSLPLDASQCPDCRGTGWWYPKGPEMGVAKCKHERLLSKDQGSVS